MEPHNLMVAEFVNLLPIMQRTLEPDDSSDESSDEQTGDAESDLEFEQEDKITANCSTCTSAPHSKTVSAQSNISKATYAVASVNCSLASLKIASLKKG